MSENSNDFVREFITPIGVLRLSANHTFLNAIHQRNLNSESLVWDEPEDRNIALILNEAEEQLLAYFAGEYKQFDLPLNMKGIPPFRQEVLKAAAKIPWGVFLTYGELAKAIGKPQASRAVGAALARTPFLIEIPCHRVIGADKALHGISAEGGIKVKQSLLELEGQRIVNNIVVIS